MRTFLMKSVDDWGRVARCLIRELFPKFFI